MFRVGGCVQKRRHTPRHSYTAVLPLGSTLCFCRDGPGRTNSRRLPRPVCRTTMTAFAPLSRTHRCLPQHPQHPWRGHHQDCRQFCRLAAHIRAGLWPNSLGTCRDCQPEFIRLEIFDVRNLASASFGPKRRIFNLRFDVDDTSYTVCGQR